ncbi:MAG: DEAD/DEAH box helicase [Armatimonadetes bacterium]|nr:DEAD/DEAH box helicase [Armatimonadota bacterium]
MIQTQKAQGFNALALPPSLLSKIDRLGFHTPTPIQRDAIPVALDGHDLIGIAQTGTGKTLAFGLPIAATLRQGEIALVLAPTRELALQIQEVLNQLNLRTALLIGGAPMGKQISQLRSRPQVIIATPGRLIDHLEQRTMDLRAAAIVVLDEADRMLDMGFSQAVRRILSQVSSERQTMLFSATMPREIVDLASQYLCQPVTVQVNRPGTTAEDVEQQLVVVHHEDKAQVLGDLLDDHKGSVLVFARTRHGARKVARNVHRMGHSSAELHSDKTLVQRRAALDGFKAGKYRVLVATDIAARGIDVKDIAVVINYDVPQKAEDYVHRIGRTGRAGASGLAITLATPDQHQDVRDIERLLKSEFPLSERSTGQLLSSKPAPAQSFRPAGMRGRKGSLSGGTSSRPRPSSSGSRPGRLFGR